LPSFKNKVKKKDFKGKGRKARTIAGNDSDSSPNKSEGEEVANMATDKVHYEIDIAQLEAEEPLMIWCKSKEDPVEIVMNGLNY